MPITLQLLQEKKIAEFFDNTEYTGDNLYPKLDLTSEQWYINYDKITIDASIIVDASSEMRLDSIARYVLGTENHVDVLVKFNKILNPFAVKKGDVILVPNLNSFFENIKKLNYKSKDIKSNPLDSLNINSSNTNTSTSVKTNGKGNKTYRKGENGVIVF